MKESSPRHAGHHAGHRVLRWVALVLTGVLAFVGTASIAAYVDLQSQIEVSDVDALIGRDRPVPQPQAESSEEPADPSDPFAGQDRNILVMGTDFRDAENAEIAGSGDEFHSDTTLLVHISGDRSRIEAVSIPRDSLVDIPSCPRPDGSSTAPHNNAMFNMAFALGGGPEQDVTGAAACTILTVESLTGLTIDDHVVVKMTGVVDIVDALGGVPMCLPEPVVGDSRYSDLDLAAGRQVLDGETSIQFLRVRKGEGMGLELGSDLQRIERQQAFVDSMLREVLAQNVITDTPQLYRMVRAALQAMSTSPDLASPSALAGLAWSLRNVDPSSIVFESVPVADAPTDSNRVVWTWEAAELWERFADDVPLHGEPSPSPSASAQDGQVEAGPDGGDGAEGSADAEGPDAGEEAGSSSGGGGQGGSVSADGGDGPSPSPSPSLLPGVCG
ncbi:LCP family protein [Isoptericola haloaureus]|uniref:LCP family protein n=1 Tax=Isoptericola haloaureus TaxID=1542902 RepID=A0ABU7Z873_9MICO